MNNIERHHKIDSYLSEIDARIKQNHQIVWEKYVQLGSRTVRLICYSKEFITPIERQLSYALRDKSEVFDATIILWNEKAGEFFLEKFIDNHIKSHINSQPQNNGDISFRFLYDAKATQNVSTVVTLRDGVANYFEAFDDSYSKHNPVVRINNIEGIISAFDAKNNVYYYGVKDLHPEEFIKQGHIFVQIFNKILKTPNSHLVHGAVVGVDNKGVLLCAKGQRGKSTLAVLSMMQGFDYVSDDYLVLEKEGAELYSYPIYSIITLSPRMYNELYHDLKGKFVSNNARRDKYVIDINAYHQTFRDKYPIKVCMFPQIVDDEKPSIVACKKGQAITQLVHSTINQLEDKHDIKSIQKLMSFIKDFEFYQINLCADIKANVECLREFCSKIN